ncbi:MAG: outer membrane beta-barrel protein [Alphaproteobacteria bacterium]
MRPGQITIAAALLAGAVVAQPRRADAQSGQPAQPVAIRAEDVDPKPADTPAVAEDTAVNFGPRYYEAPVISTLSNKGAGWDLGKAIFGEESLWDLGGWVQQSTYTNSDGLFNKHPNGFRNQQSWVYLEKKIDSSEGFSIGGRVDAMYGTDAADTQAFGNEFGKYDFSGTFQRGSTYGFAIPQAYAELGYKEFAMKLGHFYTPLGYEVVPATGNFFFSHAFTMYNSEPFTHTGALMTYSGIEKLTLFGGWTLGWDTGFDQFEGGNNFLGGFTYAPWDWMSATYLLTAGDLGWIGKGYSHSIVLNTKLQDRLTWVLLSDLTAVEANDGSNYQTHGITNYLIYSLMDELGVGARFEWWQRNSVSYYEVTGGFNISLLPNLMIRPEGRYQWGPGETASANNPAGLPVNVGIFGMDVILKF